MEEEFARQREEQERFYSNNVSFMHDFAVSMMENCDHPENLQINYDLPSLGN